MTKKFFLALATLIGTIVGVGMFSLPYLASQTSFLTILIYLILGSVLVIIIQLVYGHVVLKTPGRHQLPGYVEIYLGNGWKNFSFLVEFLSIAGSSLAYLIIGGEFLFFLLMPYFGGSVILYTLIYFALGAFLVYLGIRSVSKSELALLFVLISAVVLLFLFDLNKINFSYLQIISFKNILLPYGPVLFSLWGISIIPGLIEILGRDSKTFKKVSYWGVGLSALIYLIFIVTIFGVNGHKTSPDAISGLINNLSPLIVNIALVLGLITTFTSYISVSEVANKSFIQDLKTNKLIAWFLSLFIPLAFYFCGFKNFLPIISLTGAILLGIFGVMLFTIYLKLKKSDEKLPFSRPLIYFLIIILLLGVAGEVYLGLI